MPERSFFAELKRRRVVRVALVYGAVAFAVLQGADLLASGLSLPGWVFAAITVLTVVGFPIALVLAWAFDLTPDGVKRTGASDHQTVTPGPSGRSRIAARTVALAGIVVILLAGAWLARRSLGGDDARMEGNTLAVLPFEVRGSESVGYLGEGIVDLLSAKLSGADGIQTVEPRALLGMLAADGARSAANGEVGRRVAQRFGARFFVLGSVVEFRGEMQIRASLYETGAEPRLLLEASASRANGDLFGLIDELAAKLLAGRAVGASGRLSRLAAVTTDSITALRAYLAGERAYRGTDFLAAVEHFQTALRIDSTFALAGYRLAAAATWIHRQDLVMKGLRTGLAYADRLGERERLLLGAREATLNGEYARGDSLYRQILLLYRDEADAAYQLGEIVLHDGAYLGYRRMDAREPFERALASEGDMGPALYHAVNLAAIRGDRSALDTLNRRLAIVSTDPNDSLFTTVDRIFFDADTTPYAWAERQVAITVEPVNGFYAHEAALLTIERDPATARRLWVMVATHAPSAPVRAWAHAALADLDATLGRLVPAERELDQARRLDVALAIQQRVQLALHPLAEPAPDVLRRLRDDVSRWAPAPTSTAFTGPLETVQFARGATAVRLYLLGLIDARLGELPVARQRLRDIQADTATDATTRSNLVQFLEAEIARRDGRTEDALRQLQAAPLWRRRSIDLETGTLAFAREVFERAELLREAGHLDDATHAYEIAVDAHIQFLYRAPALFRLCEMHAAAGRRDAAREACGRFVALWSGADPGLQRWVDVARRHMGG